MADPQALRSALSDTLREFDLHLQEITWRENLVSRTLSLSLKVTGDLDEQIAIPFDDGREELG